MDSFPQSFDPSQFIFHIGLIHSAEECLERGNVALSCALPGQAEEWYRKAISLRPNYPQAWTNLGTIYQDRGDLSTAIECHLRSVTCAPNFVDGCFNLANAYKEADEPEQAIAAYERTLQLKNDFAPAHLNLSMSLLTVGRLQEAWPLYEARFLCNQPKPRSFNEPRWDGIARNGTTLLVHWEQGWGDVIMFSRYLPLLKQGTDMKVVFEVPRKLLKILSVVRGVDDWIAADDELPEFDFYVPLMSLPHLYRTTIETIPPHDSIVYTDPARVTHWRSRLHDLYGTDHGPWIGIAWQGDDSYRWDHLRSIPLKQFQSIASIPSVNLISLQKGAGSEQVKDPSLGFRVEDFDGQLDAGPDAFVDSAVLIQQLDCVITADTAVAHLAGSLGVKTWLCLSKPAHWAWMTKRTDSPWYPSVLIHRQSRQGDWLDVIASLSESLSSSLLKNRSGTAQVVR